MINLVRKLTRKFSGTKIDLFELPEYVSALENIQKEKYQLAEQELQRCLLILESLGAESQHEVLYKIAKIQKLQKKYEKTEKTLESVVEKTESNSIDHFKAYKILLKQYLQSNVPKAVELGEKLLSNLDFSESERELFYLQGVIAKQTAYLTNSEYNKAHKLLTQATEFPEYEPEALHNLACCQWWNSNLEERHINKRVESFLTPVSNFQKAIELFENIKEPYEANPDNPGLANPKSGLSLTNIGKLYLESEKMEVIKKEEAIKWLKCGLKFHEITNETKLPYVLTLVGVFLKTQKQYMHAEGLFRKALSELSGVIYIQKNNFEEKIANEKYAELLFEMEDRQSEAEKYKEKAEEIKGLLFPWSEKSLHLHIPDWSLEL